MLKFVSEPGEVKLLEEMVEWAEDGKAVPHALIRITDRRIALLVPQPGAFDAVAKLLLGWFAARIGRTGERGVTHEIRRDHFAGVELEGKLIVFRDRGEGYDHVAIAIRSTTPIDDWRGRIERWLAGTLGTAPLPVAKTVRR